VYRDRLQVPEYFLFDPHEDYLNPPFQGYRLDQGQYVPITPLEGRLPSAIVGLHLERHGRELRLYDPATGRWLPTPEERVAEERAARQQEETARLQAEAARQREQEARQQAESDVERLRREIEELRRRLPPSGQQASPSP
jgi:hypothetical protein